MSWHRENVVWPSPDGTWNRGFYASYPTGNVDDEDYDPEWDVEYHDWFDWVSTGHATRDGALRSWRGANPGGSTTYPDANPEDPESRAQLEHLEDLAAIACQNEHTFYEGPKKQRRLSAIARDLSRHKASTAKLRLQGYANLLPPEVSSLEAELAERLPGAPADEAQEVAGILSAAAADIGAAIDAVPIPRTIWAKPYPHAAVEEAKALAAELTARAQPAAPPATRAGGAAGRGKTTAKSTSGSFAPKSLSAPEATL